MPQLLVRFTPSNIIKLREHPKVFTTNQVPKGNLGLRTELRYGKNVKNEDSLLNPKWAIRSQVLTWYKKNEC